MSLLSPLMALGILGRLIPGPHRERTDRRRDGAAAGTWRREDAPGDGARRRRRPRGLRAPAPGDAGRRGARDGRAAGAGRGAGRGRSRGRPAGRTRRALAAVVAARRRAGERLAQVFAASFADGAGATVIIGSDSPALPPEYLEQAFTELRPTGARGRRARRRRPGPGTGGRRRLLPHRCRPADVGRRRRGPHRAARVFPDEQPRTTGPHAARGAGLRPAGRAAPALGGRGRAG